MKRNLAGLSDPLRVKGLTLKCRIVMAPVATDFATEAGVVTERLIEHYVRRAEALGLLIVEHSYILPQGRLSQRQLGLYDDSLISGLEKLTQSVQAMDTPIVAQITHAGSQTSEKTIGMPPVGPSASRGVHELQVSEIEDLCFAFVAAAERAVRAGFDGVEIHGAHGFLLNQFYSPLTNKRRDEYGGSLENRMRFPLEVVERVRAAVGEKILSYRLGADDMDRAGTGIEDSKIFAARLQEAGVDILDVSGGLCGSSPEKLKLVQGYFMGQARQIREVVDIPVVGVGGITDPYYADRFVREGAADLIAVGRALLKDPKWAIKALHILE